MTNPSQGEPEPLKELAEVRARLEEAEETLRALRSGDVDGIVASGDRVYTLKGADEAYRLMVQNMAEGALTIAPDGLILFSNEKFASILKIPHERIIGSSLHDFIVPEDADIFSALLTHKLRDGAKCEVRLKAPGGTLVPVSLSVNRLELDGVDCFCVIVADLTDQKRNEEVLHVLSARLLRVQDEDRRSIAHGLHDGAFQRLAALEFKLTLIGQAAAELPPAIVEQARAMARRLAATLRERPAPGLVQALMREYDLSSQEGVALMCVAEALLRIPDAATRDALIADKIGGGEWRAHVGQSPSPFVNAATWGLLITGQLVSAVDETGLAAALTRLIARSGAPVIRASVDTAMRVMGEQFVCGQTIGAAIAHARPFEARGYRYSYDMLGEAATTAEDAERYLAAYETALKAIGAASAGRRCCGRAGTNCLAAGRCNRAVN